jgi:hypothetical protein
MLIDWDFGGLKFVINFAGSLRTMLWLFFYRCYSLYARLKGEVVM